MNVELIRIEPADAEKKLKAYRRAIAARRHSEAHAATVAEWESVEAGYKAAAKGLPLIMLTQAMATGGWDESGRPRFAVSRADQRRISCAVNYGSSLRFWIREASRQSPTKSFEFPMRAMPDRPAGVRDHYGIQAIVPMVPPDVLPRLDLDLSKRAILWEADWTAPPVDPMLLLPLGGDLYAVEATWDLTFLERAAIAGR